MECITVEGVREHQAALQRIADANHGTRVSGHPATTRRSTTSSSGCGGRLHPTGRSRSRSTPSSSLDPGRGAARLARPPAGPGRQHRASATPAAVTCTGRRHRAARVAHRRHAGLRGRRPHRASRPAASRSSSGVAAPSRTKAQNAYTAGAVRGGHRQQRAGESSTARSARSSALDIPVTSVTQPSAPSWRPQPAWCYAWSTCRPSAARPRRTTSSPRPAAATTTTSSWPAPTSTRSTRVRASTTTARGRRPCSRWPSRWPRSPGQHGALRVVGRRGVRSRRLRRATSPASTERGAGQDRPLPQLRHGRRRRTTSSSSTTVTTPTLTGAGPGPRGRRRSRRRSRPSTPRSACRSRAPTSRAAPTTARSSPSASRPAACSPVPRASRPREEAALWGGTPGQAVRPLLPPGVRHPRQQRPAALDVNSDAIGFTVLQYAMNTSDVNGVPGKDSFPPVAP